MDLVDGSDGDLQAMPLVHDPMAACELTQGSTYT